MVIIDKIAAFWDVTPCSLVEIYRFQINLQLPSFALIVQAADSSETSVLTYQTTGNHTSETDEVCVSEPWETQTRS
jgi:hypothetical protein